MSCGEVLMQGIHFQIHNITVEDGGLVMHFVIPESCTGPFGGDYAVYGKDGILAYEGVVGMWGTKTVGSEWHVSLALRVNDKLADGAREKGQAQLI